MKSLDLKKVAGVVGGILLVGSIAAILKDRQNQAQKKERITKKQQKTDKKSLNPTNSNILDKKSSKPTAPLETIDENQISDDYDIEDDYLFSDVDLDIGRSANDQRSDVMNSNNPEYQANMDNRANQLNPNNLAYRSSRGKR